MREYNFYDALKEVMENGKEMTNGISIMFKNVNILQFKDFASKELTEVQNVDLYDIEKTWTECIPTVDWSKVEIDTKIEVINTGDTRWIKGHFFKFENGKVYVFNNGLTSFTTVNNEQVNYWKEARLYEEE